MRDAPVSGGVWSGIKVVFSSPYLARIALFIFLMTFASTVLYFQQAHLIYDAISDRAVRTALFAKIDLAVNVITLVGQGFIVAHVIRRLGMGWSLALVPIISVFGFVALGIFPTLAVLVVVQVLYRSLRYAVAKPTREVLFTVVDREEKYKSKAFIDAAVYRGGDLINGWIYAGLAALGMTVGAIALVAAPVAGLWALIGLQLGRRQEALAADNSKEQAMTLSRRDLVKIGAGASAAVALGVRPAFGRGPRLPLVPHQASDPVHRGGDPRRRDRDIATIRRRRFGRRTRSPP